MFGRKGSDLTLSVPITIVEATLGATIRVPTLDVPVSLKVPAGTKSGRVLRVRGKGASTSGAEGDLLVTLDVQIPGELTDDERTLFEQLSAMPSMANPRVGIGGS
jgi:molecular chaperone DnaJ